MACWPCSLPCCKPLFFRLASLPFIVIDLVGWLVLLCCCAAVLLCCCAAVLLCCCAAVLLCCCAVAVVSCLPPSPR
jgi:hypothetical protein